MIVITLSLLAPSVASAFGVSPPFITAQKLVAGSRYEATITLVQGQPDVDLEVKAVFDVPKKIRAWFSIDKGTQFIIPAGVQQFPIQVAIQVPIDAGLGIYSGYLRINTVPQLKEGEQIAISIGARIDISMTVGDDIIVDFSVKKIDILDIKENESPQIIVTIENTGNVPIAPNRATFDLLDKYGEVRLGFAQTEDLPETPAFETKTFVVKFPIDIKLGVGEYWGEARLYRNETEIGNIKTIFNVTPRPNYILFIGIGLLIIGAGVSVFIFKRKITRKPVSRKRVVAKKKTERKPAQKSKKRTPQRKKVTKKIISRTMTRHSTKTDSYKKKPSKKKITKTKQKKSTDS